MIVEFGAMKIKPARCNHRCPLSVVLRPSYFVLLHTMPTISHIVQSLEPSATLAMAAKAKELAAAGKSVFDFSLGEPDFTTPAHICQAATEAMRAGHTHYTIAS